MEVQGYAPQSAIGGKPKNGPQNQRRGRRPKGKPVQHPDEIGATIHTMPSLSKKLKGLTGCVIGLQYVWEYRSPSKSVPPHYNCKLCNVTKLQDEMLDHIKGWKHSFRYLKKTHPEKMSFEEAEALKDPTIKKRVKDIAAEVERTEGRGQLKVILREPNEVPAFHGHRSATPRPGPSLPQTGQGPHFGLPRSPPQRGGYRMGGFGGYSTLQAPPEYTTDQGPYHLDFDHNQTPDDYGPGEYDNYGDSQQPSVYSHEYREAEGMPMERQMNVTRGQPPIPSEGSNGGDVSNTLLTYLDSFKIENESDAQLVLKVTQKLTDILMEYRLRNISGGPPGSMQSVFSSSTPRSHQQFSGYPGPSRFSNDWNYN